MVRNGAGDFGLADFIRLCYDILKHKYLSELRGRYAGCEALLSRQRLRVRPPSRVPFNEICRFDAGYGCDFILISGLVLVASWGGRGGHRIILVSSQELRCNRYCFVGRQLGLQLD